MISKSFLNYFNKMQIEKDKQTAIEFKNYIVCKYLGLISHHRVPNPDTAYLSIYKALTNH